MGNGAPIATEPTGLAANSVVVRIGSAIAERIAASNINVASFKFFSPP
jgi:hypothetical protein